MLNNDFSMLEISLISASIHNELQKEISYVKENARECEYYDGYIRGLARADLLTCIICDRIKRPIIDAIVDYMNKQPHHVTIPKEDYDNMKNIQASLLNGRKVAQIFGIDYIVPQGNVFMPSNKEDKDAE